MTKRMLIDATHAEETRVVVLDGNRLEDFDVETSTKRQLKGNIYLAKVVRVEPSLQAAFVEYGGNRHGFLAFSEIHPDYYQIPVADRQRLLELQAEEARREEEEEDLELALSQGAEPPAPRPPVARAAPQAAETWADPALPRMVAQPEAWARPDMPPLLAAPAAMPEAPAAFDDEDDSEPYDQDDDQIEALPPPETVGGNSDLETGEDQREERRLPSRFLRNYKIQEVIRRRQILLVQVVKEERGTKGAALTTYLSLAGRFGVLMPNSPRGGGISRKITSAADRRRLKEVMQELDIPRGMGMIVRTAGANRPKPEIKRDCEYLLRLWDEIRDQTMKSVAPALIYEEASLIKRSIRDVYSRDIEEILVDGEEGWRAAHDFMRMLMPSHAKKVQLWRDGGQPLFARQQVEAQLDAMLSPTVQLRSGGYLVINQAEALVAIDVNSGRSTRERNIEETALRTNLEAADEAARQLRLRDLAGLIVIDFIDMESKRHNAMVERRIKEALKNDRARIQIGHISHFGLLEMSRQRLRPSLAETSFIPCPHCGGMGHVRSTENAAIYVLRGIEDEGGKRRSAEIIVHVSTPIALYLLNHKRERLAEIERRYSMRVIIAADDSQVAPQFRIEKVRVRSADEVPAVVTPERMLAPAPASDFEPDEEEADVDTEAPVAEEEEEGEDDRTGEERAADAVSGGPSAEEAERRKKRRRRRRRGPKRDDAAGVPPAVDAVAEDASEPVADDTEAPAEEGAEPVEGAAGTDEEARNRRRGRRGGRRRRRDDGELSPLAVPGADQPDLVPVYAGPTPADPFGGRAFDIFDVMDQVERAAEVAPRMAVVAEPVVVVDAQVEPFVEAAPVAVEAAEPVVAVAEVAEPVEAVPPAAAEPALNAPAPEAVEIVNTTAPDAVEILNTTAPEPVAEPALAAPDTPPAPVPANDTVAEPTSAPLIKPILIGTDGEAPAAKKRGWWRR
jgi:ribonuclease E